MEQPIYYILDSNKCPVPAGIEEWGRWMVSNDRRVRVDTIHDCKVSTVFLGMDHSFVFEKHGPVLWESLVFGGPLDGRMMRCAGTWQDAENMHIDLAAIVSKYYKSEFETNDKHERAN
jgi:hypothetical protein